MSTLPMDPFEASAALLKARRDIHDAVKATTPEGNASKPIWAQYWIVAAKIAELDALMTARGGVR